MNGRKLLQAYYRSGDQLYFDGEPVMDLPQPPDDSPVRRVAAGAGAILIDLIRRLGVDEKMTVEQLAESLGMDQEGFAEELAQAGAREIFEVGKLWTPN